jgi:glutamate/tyrosine decarboxylase-like PLP-dependent enzyme
MVHLNQAAKILGLKWKALPTYRKDDYALTGETVKAALEEDEKKGLIPFMLSGFIDGDDRVQDGGRLAEYYVGVLF